jgi:hypothetical protein
LNEVNRELTSQKIGMRMNSERKTFSSVNIFLKIVQIIANFRAMTYD